MAHGKKFQYMLSLEIHMGRRKNGTDAVFKEVKAKTFSKRD